MAQSLGFIFSPGGIIVSLLVGKQPATTPLAPRGDNRLHVRDLGSPWMISSGGARDVGDLHAALTRDLHDPAGLGYDGVRGWLRF